MGLRETIWFLVDIFLGAYWVQDSIYAFKKKRYCKFGFDVMMIIADIALIVKYCFLY